MAQVSASFLDSRMLPKGWAILAALTILQPASIAATSVSCPTYNTWRDEPYPSDALNAASLEYCIFDSGSNLGMFDIYQASNPFRSVDLTDLIEDSAPSMYSINLLGGRFNMSICAAARIAKSALHTCGADALSPEEAMTVGYRECAQSLYDLITSVFHQSGGGWKMGGTKVYLDERQVSGDWDFVAASKTSVMFGSCANASAAGDPCSTPCPSMGINLYSLGANYASCPYRGSSTMTLSTNNIPSQLFVQTTGNDSWTATYQNWRVFNWSTATAAATPVNSYSISIVNTVFEHDIFAEVTFLGAWMIPAFLTNLAVVCIFLFSHKDERRRPFDLVAGVCFCDLVFVGSTLVWWWDGYGNGYNQDDSEGRTSEYVYPFIAQYTILLSWVLYGAVAHDLIQQIKNPFAQGVRVSLHVVLGIVVATGIYLALAFAFACSFTDCHARGNSILLFPWVGRKYTHFYNIEAFSDGKSSLIERFGTLGTIFVLPSFCVLVYSMYAYVYGKYGLRGGLTFSHAVRKRSFTFRKGYLLGHALLWSLLIGALIAINQSGHCVDGSGLKISSMVFALRAIWTIILFLQHAEGPHRRLLRKILETQRMNRLTRLGSTGQRDTEMFSRSIELDLNPTAVTPVMEESRMSRRVSMGSAGLAGGSPIVPRAPVILKDEDAVLRAEVVHLVADGVWLSTCHSAQLQRCGRCCSHFQPTSLGAAGLEEKHTFSYPEAQGQVSVESFVDRISGVPSNETGRYEFSAINATEFSRLRIQWYHDAMKSVRCSMQLPSPKESKHQKHAFEGECSHQSSLSSEVSEGEVDDGERYYLKSVEVPENAEDVATIIKESWNTGGKSGAPLYFSADKKLVIKMLDEGEFSFLSEYSLKYCEYVQKNVNSLLSRVQGLYTIRMRPQQDLFRFMVMSNAALSSLGWKIFARYDLKGSTSTRRSRLKTQHTRDDSSLSSQWTAPGQHTGTLLDLDYIEDIESFERPVQLSVENKALLLGQILEDVRFLASNKVMDYSLFVCRAQRKIGAPDPVGYHSLHCFQSAANDEECFYFSFLDITQQWNEKKAAERFAKVCLLRRNKHAVSSAPPGYYANRFVHRMNEYIKPVLEDDHPVLQRVIETDWDEYNFLDRCC